MTDNTPWHAPEGAAPAPASPAFAPPGTAAGTTPPPPGWTPPPKPGLIPLRPLTLGNILGASFQVLRRNPRPTFGFSLVLNAIIGVFGLVVVGIATFLSLGRLSSISDASNTDAIAIAFGAEGTILLSALVPGALALVTSAILQGIISLEVARGTVGERLRLGGLWRKAKGRIGALIGWSFILIGAVVAVLLVLTVVIAVIIGFGGTAGIVIGVLLGVLSAGGLFVVAVWIGTRVSLVPSVLMLERLSLRSAVARSWSLTVGSFWKTLGIQALVAVILTVASRIISAPVTLVIGLGSTQLDPSGSNQGFIVTAVVVYVLTLIVLLVFGSISSIVQSATTALIYIDLRMRREGLDLELAKFVEARQAGDASATDPYLVSASPTAAAAPSESPWA